MISAAMIFRDDSSTLEVALQSVRPHVDQLVCIDTGSVDGSNEIARRYADRLEVYLGCNDPESGLIADFADARNKSFDLADGDVAFWFDADDELVNGERIRMLADQLRQFDLAQALLPYHYMHDAEGRPTVVHYRERLLFPRHRFQWMTPVHEVCMPIVPFEGGPLQSLRDDGCFIRHRQDKSTTPREERRNLRILRRYIAQVGTGDHRAFYYLGCELLRAGELGPGMSTLRRFLEISDPKSDEHAEALLDLARASRAIGDLTAAVDFAGRAILVKSWVQPFFELAKATHALAVDGQDPEWNMRRCAAFAQTALMLNPSGGPETVQTQNPIEYYEVHKYLNHALASLGMLDEALASCESGLKGLPCDEMLLNNRELWRKEIRKRTIKTEAHALAASGAINENAAKLIEHLVNGTLEGAVVSAPSAETAPAVPDRAPIAERQPDPGKLDLVFFVGPGLEPWSPKTLEAGGMGGSETMVWELSKRLAGLGNRVRVYGHCTPTMEGVYEGVEWLDHSRFRGVQCDVMISSRRPEVVDDDFRLKAGARVLWIHDVHCGQALSYSRDLRFDRVFALSQWHKRFLCDVYPSLNPEKIIVTRNGIDLSRFDGDEPRNPHRAVYSSSPDRGLWTALDCWPRIRQAVPDAELHVYYGFQNWERTCQLNNDAAGMQSLQHLRHLAMHTVGVVFHDRINQRELAREFMRSGVWAYPNWFQESSCCTAMEAQAAGLRIVCSPIAALNETVADRGVMIGRGDREGDQDPGEWRSAEYMEAFTGAVIEAMTRPESDGWAVSGAKPDGWTRDELTRYAAEHFGLDELAADWYRMLGEILADVRARVVPAFREVAA